MVKAIFTTKIDPAYDDLPEERYHFPKAYLNQVKKALGDWIIYYEPRRSSDDLNSRGGRQAYFATAKLSRIEADPNKQDHYYAFVEHFLEFDRPVDFKEGASFYETALKRKDGKTNKGAFGRAVRNLPDIEYEMILLAGFTSVLNDFNAEKDPDQGMVLRGFSEAPQQTFERPIIEKLIRRPFRERAFSVNIKAAYRNTCAMTGLKIINGGGRSEVQAAHIRPVASDGPDTIRNGIALSGTVHWMFDRGLISVDADFSILVARDKIPIEAQRILNSDMRIILPNRLDNQPHGLYLKFHRENIFKG